MELLHFTGQVWRPPYEASSQLLQVTAGLVGRKIYPSVPPKVEYYVSEFGETLIPHLEQLKQWGQENFETIMENRLKNKY